MSTIGPTCVASVTATTVADAPGARRPRSHRVRAGRCPGTSSARCASSRNDRGSSTLTPFTSVASTVDRFVTVIVHVIRPPTLTTVGFAVFTTTRSSSRGFGGLGVVGGVALRTFVKVQTTTSPWATVLSIFVPGRRRQAGRSACSRRESRSRRGSYPVRRSRSRCPRRPRPRSGRRRPVPAGDDGPVVDLEHEDARVARGLDDLAVLQRRGARLRARLCRHALTGNRPRQRPGGVECSGELADHRPTSNTAG